MTLLCWGREEGQGILWCVFSCVLYCNALTIVSVLLNTEVLLKCWKYFQIPPSISRYRHSFWAGFLSQNYLELSLCGELFSPPSLNLDFSLEWCKFRGQLIRLQPVPLQKISLFQEENFVYVWISCGSYWPLLPAHLGCFEWQLCPWGCQLHSPAPAWCLPKNRWECIAVVELYLQLAFR